MRHIKRLILPCSLIATLAIADELWTPVYKKLNGTYLIYGGELGDTFKPTPDNKKIAIAIEGPGAKSLFDAIGPDIKNICGTEDGTRIREKDNGSLACSRSKRGEYQCHFGFDLRTGKSIGGIIC